MQITHNLLAQNTLLHYNINQKKILKTTGKLSSGYRINKAADDAAGLQISEGMRSQIRGLMRSTQNAEEGMSFVQSGDGAMNEISNIIHRMRELAIESSNDTNTAQDRAALQAEFDQLQSEIDRINDHTEFNTQPIFEHYSDTYYTYNGNRYWSQDQIHTITDRNNSLTISYQISDEEPEKELTLSIANGTYTTQELIDAMDDVVTSMGDAADGLYLEYTKSGTCNMALQNGENISDVTGGLSYLFFDEYGGSDVGILIGTTEFVGNYPLEVNEKNNELKFKIEYYTGTVKNVSITVPEGEYLRQEMIDYLNSQLSGTGMTASEYGNNCIQIGGPDGMITGLKGNMFKIDDKDLGEEIMTSVFYDNTKYGSVTTSAAIFKGGAVLNTSDATYNKFQITDQNNTLCLKVNGSDNDGYTTITLNKGAYTISEMSSHLQNKLKAAGLDATVSIHTERLSTPNKNTITFSGLTITSDIKGLDSNIIFDIANSSAYDTLFVKRKYTDTANKISTTLGNFTYKAPTLTGGKTFSTSNLPLTIDSSNSSFQIKITEKEAATGTISSNTYTINLTEKNYGSLSEILKEINEQLNGANAPADLKDKIQAVNYEDKIRFTSFSGNQTVTGISFSDTGLEGYKVLFVGTSTTTSAKTVSDTGLTPGITLDEFNEPTTFDKDEKLVVNVNGSDRTATVPAGTYTQEELSKVITQQLKGSTTTSPKQYTGHGEGTTTDNSDKTYSNTGITTPKSVTCIATGNGTPKEGSTAEDNATPASYTMPVTLPSSITIDNSSNTLNITVNKNKYTVQLDAGTYTPATLAKALNNKLDSVIAAEGDKMTVKLNSSNQLVFQTVGEGSRVGFRFDSSDSSLIKELATSRTNASATINLALKSSIQINDSSNTFTFTLDGAQKTVTLANGTYTRSGLVTALNNAFSANGIATKASLSGSKLILSTTQAKGNDSSISYTTKNGGSSCSALFGELVTHTAAVAKLDAPLLSSIEMKSGENTFIIQTTNENGTKKNLSITIPEGTYNQDQLVEKMNSLLGGEVTVTKDSSGYLIFTTKAKGKKVSLDINNSISGTAGKAMFGETTVVVPDITASFEDNKLKLSGSKTGSSYKISVSSNTSPGFLKPKTTTNTVNPKSTAGSVTTVKFTLKSKNTIGSSLKIEDYNKDFSFNFQSPSGTKKVDIVLTEQSYSASELKTALQNQIDAALGADMLTVSVTGSGITFQANNYGSDYSMTNMSGGFYEYVMKGTVDRETRQTPSNANGKQSVTDTYIIGRKNIRNSSIKIVKDVTDTLSLDLTINNTVHTLDLVLDAKTYSTSALVEELQKKLNQQAKAAGLPENLILVGVGKYNTNVYGNNDANALTFYLNKDINLTPGQYKIDGLTGNSLYEIFYKTEGELIPSYIEGTRDISKGVTIEDDQTELSFDLDGISYNYSLQAGTYTAKEFLDMANDVLSARDNNGNSLAAKVSLSGNSLRLSLTKLGKHKFENLGGTSAPAILYQTHSRKDYHSTFHLQVGSNANQLMELERFSLSTLNMGINSITVSQRDNAQKAIRRLDEALTYLNEKRSIYGAIQNRLEHAIAANENTAQNLQSSESLLRDTDVAKGIMQLSHEKILQQAQEAMLTQANHINDNVLSLLA